MKNIYKCAFIGLLLFFSPLGVLAQSAWDYVIRGNNAQAKQEYTTAIIEYGKAAHRAESAPTPAAAWTGILLILIVLTLRLRRKRRRLYKVIY